MDTSGLLLCFGRNVSTLRQSKGISQEKLAELAGLDRTYISSVERGKRNVSLLNIVRIASALGVAPCVLLEPIGMANESH